MFFLYSRKQKKYEDRCIKPSPRGLEIFNGPTDIQIGNVSDVPRSLQKLSFNDSFGRTAVFQLFIKSAIRTQGNFFFFFFFFEKKTGPGSSHLTFRRKNRLTYRSRQTLPTTPKAKIFRSSSFFVSHCTET